MRNYSFKPGLGISLLFVSIFTLFMGLSLWQFQRAEQKTALMTAREQRGQDAPVRLDGAAADVESLRYRRVEAEGEYDAAHQFLLDNQLHEGQPGYQVLTPLRLAGGGAVLVNRGWLPLGADRNRLPEVNLVNPRVRVTGVVDHFPRVGLKLQGAEIPGPGWPARVQVAEPQPLAERLGYPVLPYQVLLDPTAEQGYVRAFRAPSLAPEKNRGYALQWLLFAAVAAGFYLRHGLIRGRTH